MHATGGATGASAEASASAQPSFSPLLFRFFVIWLRRYFAKRFHAVRLSRSGGIPELDGRPVVFFSNHPSWWDPVLYMVLGESCFPGLQGYGPMEASAAGKYGILRRLGVFGVELGTRRGAAQFLRTSEEVLKRERSSLWLTPEGEFTDPRRRPVELKSGLAHLARRLPDAVLIPLALEYTFWNESRPEALARFGAPLQTREHASLDAEAWNRLLTTRLQESMDVLADEAGARDAAAFRTIVQGGSGVGGLYDLWRRSWATLTGRPFRAGHEDSA